MARRLDPNQHDCEQVNHEDLKASFVLGLGVALFYLAFISPAIYSIDGQSMLAVSESLILRHNFEVPPHLGMLGHNGHYYSHWYPLLSIVALPFVALGLMIGKLWGLPSHYVAGFFALFLPAVFTATTVPLTALIAIQLGAARRAALLSAFSLAFGTIALVYYRTFFAEPLLALIVAASLCCAFTQRKKAIFATGELTCLAVLSKPVGILLGPVLTTYLFRKRHSLQLACILLFGAAVGLGLYMIYNFLRFNEALQFGLPYSRFEIRSIWKGVFGLLLSPGRGIFWPPVILSVIAGYRLKTRKPDEFYAIAAISLAFLFLHGAWKGWNGGWSWGPRFLVPVIPALLAITATLEKPYRLYGWSSRLRWDSLSMLRH